MSSAAVCSSGKPRGGRIMTVPTLDQLFAQLDEIEYHELSTWKGTCCAPARTGAPVVVLGTGGGHPPVAAAGEEGGGG